MRLNGSDLDRAELRFGRPNRSVPRCGPTRGVGHGLRRRGLRVRRPGAGPDFSAVPASFLVLAGWLLAAPMAWAGGVSLGVNRMLVVSAGDSPAANCQGLKDVLASITDATADNPYLLKLEPGVFACGATGITMKPYVHIEGSGQEVTRITSLNAVATVTGKSNAEIRQLTLEADGGIFSFTFLTTENPALDHVTLRASGASSSNTGLIADGGASPSLRHVTIEVTDELATSNTGIALGDAAAQLYAVYITVAGGTNGFGLRLTGADTVGPVTRLVVRDSSIYVTADTNAYGIVQSLQSEAPLVMGSKIRVYGAANDNFAVHNKSSPITIRHSTLEASGTADEYFGIYNENTAPGTFLVTVDNSEIIGQTGTVRNGVGFDTKIGGSLLSGGNMKIDGGTVVCAGVWDETYAFSAGPTCP
ncbi:MAG: hypothetical protein IH936_14050 [Acidobacteria bacterium]|nr:hypothetical protein [Acidobacteriota bacterium]